MKRAIAAIMVVAFVAAGCKSKDAGKTEEEAKPGTGTATGTGTGTATAPATKAATITLPGGGDASAYTAKVVAPPQTEELDRIAGVYEVLKTVELGPDGTQLPAPAIVTVTIDNLPAGRSIDEVEAALISANGSVDDVKIVARNGNELQVEVTHFSLLTFALGAMGIGVLAVLTMSLRGGSDPITKKDCDRFIDPSGPKVQAIASDPAKFAVDTKTGDVTIDVGKPLKGKDVDQGAHLLTASQVIDKAEGDCVNMSTLFASVMAAKNYPVRQVSGTATYNRNGKTYKGGHQWVEVVIDRKTYYVDTFQPNQTKLIPIDQASADLSLKRGRMCGKGLGSTKYDPQWYVPFETDPLADKREQLEVLKAEHRKLNADCQANVAGACSARQDKYDEAKKLQEEINALEAAAPAP